MMRLHLDKDAFCVLIDIVSEKTGYRSDVLEKELLSNSVWARYPLLPAWQKQKRRMTETQDNRDNL